MSAPIEARGFPSDIDASIRYAVANASQVRFLPGIGWLVWDEKRWAEDRENQVIELAKTCARLWTEKAARSTGKERDKRLREALTLESASHVRAAVELSRSDPRLVSSVAAWDRDPWRLNVENGTLDLQTGELFPHHRDDMLTKLAPVRYDPEAKHPALDSFLAHLASHSSDIVGFLGRCAGVALTGDASTETLFLVQGGGGGGKTTLLEGLAAMLGDYAVKMPFESFCLSKHGRSPGGASPDLIRLRGSRLAYASEGDQSARLDSGIVKTLSGNEPLTARALYQAPITFPQTWKLWLVSNFDPKTDAEDTGIWRRLLKLHFHEIPKAHRDPAIKAALVGDPNARSALLAWAVAGCLDWQQRGGGRAGLAAPADVEAATEEYRRKQDTLAQWWEDLLIEATLIPAVFTTAAKLRGHYQDWCSENGAMAIGVRRFADYLEARGLRPHRTNDARGWLGILLG